MSDLGNQPNKARGEVPITINGETYALRPSFRAIELIENQVGPLPEIFNRISEGRMKVTDTITIIRAGLIGQDIARRKNVAEIIWQSNPAEQLLPVTRFITSCLTGGQEVLDELDDEQDPPAAEAT